MISDTNIVDKLIKLTSTDYPIFAEYCNLLDKGMRKDALKRLDKFLDSTRNWDYSTKASFCTTIFSVSINSSNDVDFVLTMNLVDKLVKPTLLEMTTLQTDNFLAFRWYGQYFRDTKFVKKAYELNPSDIVTKLILLNRLDYDVWTSTHHLPDGYVENIEKEEQDIKLAFSLLEGLDKNTTEELFDRFTEYKNEVDKYKLNKNKPSH